MKAHEGTEHVRQGKMDLIKRELELFFMKDGKTVREMYDRLMLLVSDIRALGSQDWDDSKATKKFLTTFAPKDKNLTAMIRRDQKYPTMTPNQLLGEILHQDLVDQDVEKSLSLKMNKSLALNACSNEVVEVKPKTSMAKKEDTSDEGSTDEETTFAIRKYKKFLKSRTSRKGGEKERRSLKGNAMSVESMDTSLPSVRRTKTRMRKRRNTRRRARSTRRSIKGVLTWVNNGTRVMKMRNQRSKA
jgi:hypothetical protein